MRPFATPGTDRRAAGSPRLGRGVSGCRDAARHGARDGPSVPFELRLHRGQVGEGHGDRSPCSSSGSDAIALRASRPVVSSRGYIISAISVARPHSRAGRSGRFPAEARPVMTPSVAVQRNGLPGSAAHVASRSTNGRLSSTSAPTPFGPRRGLIVRHPGKACQLRIAQTPERVRRGNAQRGRDRDAGQALRPGARDQRDRAVRAQRRQLVVGERARGRRQVGGGAGSRAGRRAQLPAFSARSATARIVTYEAATSAAGSPAGLSLTSRRISRPAFWMSSCASIDQRLPPAARGVAVKISLPGRKIAVDQVDLGAVRALVDHQRAGQVEQRYLDLPPDRRQTGRRARDVGADQRRDDLAIVRGVQQHVPDRRGRGTATIVAARTCGVPGFAGQSTRTTSAVPSAGSAAARSAPMSGFEAAGATGRARAARRAGTPSTRRKAAGMGNAAPAVSSRDKAPKSTPGRIAVTSSSL